MTEEVQVEGGAVEVPGEAPPPPVESPAPPEGIDPGRKEAVFGMEAGRDSYTPAEVLELIEKNVGKAAPAEPVKEAPAPQAPGDFDFSLIEDETVRGEVEKYIGGMKEFVDSLAQSQQNDVISQFEGLADQAEGQYAQILGDSRVAPLTAEHNNARNELAELTDFYMRKGLSLDAAYEKALPVAFSDRVKQNEKLESTAKSREERIQPTHQSRSSREGAPPDPFSEDKETKRAFVQSLRNGGTAVTGL